MLVRTAAPADIPQMFSLAEQADAAAHWSVHEYEALFAVHAPKRIALIMEEPAGIVAGFVVARCGDEEWEIENVVVEAKLRRRGIARSLIQELLKLARSRDASAVLLEVRESNTAARGLYERIGFVEEGRRPKYYHDSEEDAVLLRVRV